MHATRSIDPSSLFDLQNVLGKGAFAAVYLAADKFTKEAVAIKLVRLEKTKGRLEQFQSEIAALSGCHSEYVTSFYGALVYEEQLWIVMEFVGPSAHDVQKVLKKIPEDPAAVIAHEVLMGLQYLHTHGQLHLDIKPANILISVAGSCKLCDLGVSTSVIPEVQEKKAASDPYPWLPPPKRTSESSAAAEDFSKLYIGTPLYMAPEMIRRQPHSPKCDVWSLGISTIEMLTGHLPRSELHVLKAVWSTANDAAPSLGPPHSAKAIAFVTECLQKDPRNRSSVDQLLVSKFAKGATKKKVLASLIATYNKELSTIDAEEADDDDDDDHVSSRHWREYQDEWDFD